MFYTVDHNYLKPFFVRAGAKKSADHGHVSETNTEMTEKPVEEERPEETSSVFIRTIPLDE